MKLVEIYVNPSRDEFIDGKQSQFDQAQPVAKIKNLILKKVVTADDIIYGLFDKNLLVGYFHITKYNPTLYQVVLVQLAQSYKGQGYGTFLYDYAILNDHITLLSDNRQTPESQKLWLKFKSAGHFQVAGYDTATDKLIPNATAEQVYDNDNMVWVGVPTGKSINESLETINAKYKGDRTVVWYGPGTTSELYFNF